MSTRIQTMTKAVKPTKNTNNFYALDPFNKGLAHFLRIYRLYDKY